jgi:hypothetical protein
MANNRMVLVCSICAPGEWKYGPEIFVIAKFYPSTSWYSNGIAADNITAWFSDHRHDDSLMYGKHQFRLEYEVPLDK